MSQEQTPFEQPEFDPNQAFPEEGGYVEVTRAEGVDTSLPEGAFDQAVEKFAEPAAVAIEQQHEPTVYSARELNRKGQALVALGAAAVLGLAGAVDMNAEKSDSASSSQQNHNIYQGPAQR